ncbi:MAG: hypothetical protein E6Q97_28840 [Desulfurellales bacterium]|nr:MAG: hypothetical protein E6Q97_28840 [Desulfurellales bacterium]
MSKRRNNSGAAKTDAFANAMRKSRQPIEYDPSTVVAKWGPHTLTGFADGDFFCLPPVDLKTVLLEVSAWNEKPTTCQIDDVTQSRFDAIAEIMTRLSPTVTRSSDTVRFSPLADDALDAEYEHRLAIASSANGWCICECSWHPSAPSLTMGGGQIPANETPDQTARRLLGGLDV